jgi:hypothetical protein
VAVAVDRTTTARAELVELAVSTVVVREAEAGALLSAGRAALAVLVA